VKETDEAVIAQICYVKRNVGVATPVRSVKFTVAVLPESAADGKCRAAPKYIPFALKPSYPVQVYYRKLRKSAKKLRRFYVKMT